MGLFEAFNVDAKRNIYQLLSSTGDHTIHAISVQGSNWVESEMKFPTSPSNAYTSFKCLIHQR